MVAEISLNWIQDGPNHAKAHQASAAVAGIRPRRAHTKSRQGCTTCKRRRKKCDEIRPTCGQCQHMNIQCDYLPAKQSTAKAMTLSQGRSQHSMSRQAARNEIFRVLQANDRKPAAHKLQYVDYLQLIDHFLTDTTPWIGSPQCQKVLQQHGIRLGLEAPHFLHAILAFSASHIDYMHPDLKFRLAAVHHCDRLLSLYSAEMRRMNSDNVVHLYGTCTLLSYLSYLGVSYDNPDIDGDPEGSECDFDAFRSLQGTRILQADPALRTELLQSVWLPALQEAQQWDQKHEAGPVTACHEAWSSRLTEELCALCGVSLHDPDPNNVYLDPLRRLNDLIQLQMDDAVVGQLMDYVALLSPEFMKILSEFESKALLINCYWMTLLLQAGQWWIVQTAIGACRRMGTYLWFHGDDNIRRLLRFPAAQCGLDLVALERRRLSEQPSISVSPPSEKEW